MEHSFLIHHAGDDVGVAVVDIGPGEEVVGVFMDTGESLKVTTKAAIPLGHKVAVDELDEGGDVIKYGVRIGRATTHVAVGDHVHTHNVRSARW